MEDRRKRYDVVLVYPSGGRHRWRTITAKDPEDFHIVTDLTRLGLGQGLRCDCVAGVHRQTCGHAAAVALARERHAARRLREQEAGR